MLLNSNEVQGKLSAGRAGVLVQTASRRRKAGRVVLGAFARAPSSGELTSALNHLAKNPQKKREAYEDILWL